MEPQDKLDNSASSLPELNLSQPATSYLASNPLQPNLSTAPQPMGNGLPTQSLPLDVADINPLMQSQHTTQQAASDSFAQPPNNISNYGDKKSRSEQYVIEVMKAIEQNGQDPRKQLALIEQIKIRYLQEICNYTVKRPEASR